MSDTNTKLRSRCTKIYMLYIAAILFSLIPNIPIATLAIILGIIGIVMAYGSREMTQGTLYESHVQWLVRTFWIGGAVLLPIATVIFTVVIMKYGDMTAAINLSEQLLSGGATEELLYETSRQYMRDNLRLFIFAGAPTLGLTLLWWLSRCFKGLNKLSKDQAVAKPGAFV